VSQFEVLKKKSKYCNLKSNAIEDNQGNKMMNEWDGFKTRQKTCNKKNRFRNLESNLILAFKENGVEKSKMR
jgi:hypothetical protein